MIESPLIARRNATRLLMGPLAAFCVSTPFPGRAAEDDQEKVAAERVAKKVENAKHKTHEDEEEREALQQFAKEVAEYQRLHDRERKKVGPVESDAAQKALAGAIIARRGKARQGDVFVTEVQPVFKRRIAEQLKGPDTHAARKAVVEGNPGHDEDSPPVPVLVNAPYPRGATRSTVPPSVLSSLPPLPGSLNYLFVGRNLILIDAVAQVIVDFLPAAAPELVQ
jgi:hypothetical protein